MEPLRSVCGGFRIRGGWGVLVPAEPGLLGKLVNIVAVEHLPEGRAENPLCVQDGQAERISIYQLMGVFINAHFAADLLCGDKEGQNGFTHHIEVLGKAAKGYVHIIEGLGEHINGNAVVTDGT